MKKKNLVKVEESDEITPDTLVNVDFLRKIGVEERSLSKALDKLNQAEIGQVSTLLTLSKDDLKNDVKLSIGTVGKLMKFIDSRKEQDTMVDLGLESVRLTIPSYEGLAKLDYCKPIKFLEIKSALECYQSDMGKGSGRFKVPVVIGASGIGKIRTVYEVCKETIKDFKEYSPIFIRIRVDDLKRFERASNVNQLLALLVLDQLAPGVPTFNLQFATLIEKIKKDLKTNLILLNLDEFQYDLVTSQEFIRTACRVLTDADKTSILVFPIVSGVPKVQLETNLQPGSAWQPEEIILAPPTSSDLKAALYKRLEITATTCFAIDNLFEACGDFPFLVDNLAETILENKVWRTATKENKFKTMMSSSVWDKFRERVRWRFQKRLWFDVLSSDPKTLRITNTSEEMSKRTDDVVDVRKSNAIKEKIMKKLMFLALSGIPVEIQTWIVPDCPITYRQASVLYELIPQEKVASKTLYLIRFPLIVAYIVQSEFDIVPTDVIRSSPFEEDPTLFEVYGMVAISAHLLARTPQTIVTPIMLRPGAQVYSSTNETLSVIVPADTQLVKLVNHLKGKNGEHLPFTTEIGGQDIPVEPGLFFLAAKDQPALDGGGVLQGTLDAKSVQVCILSQFKMLREHEPSSSKPSTTLLHDSTVEGILAGLRKVRNDLSAKLPPGSQDEVIYVYDILTSRNSGDWQGKNAYELDRNEVLLVTNFATIDEALGPVLSVRHSIRKRVKLQEEQ